MSATRVVLDTNVVVSLWVFDDPRYAALREALEDGRWQALTNEACLAEFKRVLGYPQFAIDVARQREIFEAYERRLRRVEPTGSNAPLPVCSDPDDQKFLQLAHDGAAAWLITGDRALLRLARRRRLAHLFGVVTPDAALALSA